MELNARWDITPKHLIYTLENQMGATKEEVDKIMGILMDKDTHILPPDVEAKVLFALLHHQSELLVNQDVITLIAS